MFSHLNTYTIGKFYISKITNISANGNYFQLSYERSFIFDIDDILKETENLAKHHRDVVPRKSEGLKENYS